MKIAFLGIGLMGEPLAEKFIGKSKQLYIYNRTKSKTKELIKKGAIAAETPAEAIKGSNIIFTMVTDYPALCSLLFSDGHNTFSGRTIIQMSTISPGESELLEERIESFGGEYIEAPVLGSIPQIKDGSLMILCGGKEELVNKYKPVLEFISNNITYVGNIGSAAAIKLALNQFIPSLAAIFSASYSYLLKNNINTVPFMNILKHSALYAPTYEKKISNYDSRNYDNPNFPLKHMLKDINLIETQFKEAKINTSILEAVKEILINAVGENLGDKDYSALYEIINPKK
ncbi:hydroxyacid dehydrogenase [bacterium BRH_c32]|nr:MAG: hydroxyacid dehydrogenase [bacterium BRH_c32]KUO60978.1 MAG: hydroxyacid dehydrogenase [bacterium BRH_c32]